MMQLFAGSVLWLTRKKRSGSQQTGLSQCSVFPTALSSISNSIQPWRSCYLSIQAKIAWPFCFLYLPLTHIQESSLIKCFLLSNFGKCWDFFLYFITSGTEMAILQRHLKNSKIRTLPRSVLTYFSYHLCMT